MDGVNRFVGEILAGMVDADETCIGYLSSPLNTSSLKAGLRKVPGVLGRPGFLGNISRLLWKQLALERALRRDHVDVVYHPCPEGALWSGTPQVLTVLDVLPLQYPSVYPRLRYYFRWVLPRLLRRASGVVVISKVTRDVLSKTFGPMHCPVEVVPCSYREDCFHCRDETGVRSTVERLVGGAAYILCVGETRPYKNLRRLISAFAKLERSDLVLAVAGSINRRDPLVVDLPETCGVAGRVKFLGRVSDEDLADLYAGARLLCFPSLQEGFGMPPLEAMACGCPVVASHIPVVREVCGEAALFVDPRDVASIVSGMSEMLGHRETRERFIERGYERVGDFSWSSSAKAILAFCRNVAENAQ